MWGATHHKRSRDEYCDWIGKNGYKFAFIKRMTFYFVYLSDRKTMSIAPEMTQFSPINECLSLFVILLTIAQIAEIQAFLCKINKKV